MTPRVRVLFLVGGLLFSALAAAACGSAGDEDHAGDPRFVITVQPDQGGGYKAWVSGGKSGAGLQVPYPGLLAYRVNHMLAIENPLANNDGTRLTFRVTSHSAKSINLLWFILSETPGTAVSPGPRLVNGRGQKVYVLGPLDAGESRLLTFDVQPAGPEGYSLYLDFLQIGERIAFMSNRANAQEYDRTEIFTANLDGSMIYQVTRDSPDITSFPEISPGGEWIAFERLLPQQCPTKTYDRSQVFIVHPDGSNLRQVSQNMFQASTPTFSPTGRFLAYDCRQECEDVGASDISICIADLETGQQKVLFSAPYLISRQIFYPKWSPDGNFMVMKGFTVDEKGRTATAWLYARMDPFSGDSLSTPVIFSRNTKSKLMEDDYYYRFVIDEFEWAPDSRHALVRGMRLKMTLQTGRWKIFFKGLMLFDFLDLINSPSLPDVPVPVEILPDQDREAHFPQFNPQGTRLYYDIYHNSAWADIMFLELEDYLPAGSGPQTLIGDHFYNRTPGLRGPALKTFFH